MDAYESYEMYQFSRRELLCCCNSTKILLTTDKIHHRRINVDPGSVPAHGTRQQQSSVSARNDANIRWPANGYNRCGQEGRRASDCRVEAVDI